MRILQLYRYRSVERALEEIEKGTWYFAGREELNDPIEGYVRVYWQGDRPAWSGLFRNYICSLFMAMQHYLLTDEKTYLNKSSEEILKGFRSHSLLKSVHQFDSLPLGMVLQELRQQFLNNPIVQGFVQFYGDKKIKCSAKELHLILTAIHSTAFSDCIEKFQQLKVVSPEYHTPSSCDEPFPVEKLQYLYEGERKKILELFSEMLADNLEWELSFKFNIPKDTLTINLHDKQQLMNLEVQLNYPAIYISQLEELLYPDGYVICFSKQNDNSAMWGNYAKNHTGVCLIYETKQSDSKEVIELSPGNIRKVDIAKVNYSNNTLQKNFFDTLTNMTYAELEYWLKDEQGNQSKYLKEYDYYSSENWHRNYWEEYKEKFLTKMKAWEYEQEYRAIIRPLEAEKHIFSYNSAAFKGIIFGINTSAEDKINLIRKIRSVSQLSDDFKFYQAEYDDDLQKIIIREKKYLSIKGDRKKQIQDQVMSIGEH